MLRGRIATNSLIESGYGFSEIPHRRIMSEPDSIIAELEDAVRSGSSEKRVSTLRQVTDLFLHGGERLSEDQIKVFDDVLCHLITRVETRAKAELSKRLATLDYAPLEVIQQLARDDKIAVAEDILVRSNRLTTDTLVEIASTKGQDHLFAISGRADLPEVVTDVIVNRGERRVVRKLAGNTSARFSEAGYAGMVVHAEADDELTEILGLRTDLPINFLRDLLRRATDAVRARLMAIAPPELQEEVSRVLKAIADAAGTEPQQTRDFTRAEAIVRRMKGLNELNDAAIIKLAESRRFDEVTAALAIQTNVPCALIAKVMEGHRADLMLIPCRAAALAWPTVKAILTYRQVKPRIDERTLEIAGKDYGKLSVETAQRTLRFWQLHDKIEK
jgi:uncharacterized protein (DUF2336 family)